jgi:hypothetical protein
MKELIKKQIYLTFKQSNNLPKIIKELLFFLLIMIIIVCYYLFIFNYILNINNELITTCTITVEELKSIEKVPNI